MLDRSLRARVGGTNRAGVDLGDPQRHHLAPPVLLQLTRRDFELLPRPLAHSFHLSYAKPEPLGDNHARATGCVESGDRVLGGAVALICRARDADRL